MNLCAWQRIVKNGSLMLIICFSVSFFFGVIAEASTLSVQADTTLAGHQFNTVDSKNYIVGFGNDGTNFIHPDSSSKNVDVTARVHVRAYHRKDGTYVRSHYRRNPRR